jgi:hypothetical protein
MRFRLRLAELFGGEVRATDLAHLAGPHEFIERAERLFDRRLGVGLMELVKVYAVSLQPA